MTAARVRVLSELSASHDGFDVSDERMLKALRNAEERHFWHRTRNEFIVARLGALGIRPPARFLDLGCGGGCVAESLSEFGFDVVGVDGQRSLVGLAATRAPWASFYLHNLSRGVDEIPERDFDVVGLFDVIEHLQCPLDALTAATRLARQGGYVVGTVPSLMSLWSAVDELAGHQVRYERESLGCLLERVEGCELVEVAPFNRSLVPLMWAQRRMMHKPMDRARMSESNLSVPARPVNFALAAMLRMERRLGRYLDRLPVGGASLWFALKKG